MPCFLNLLPTPIFAVELRVWSLLLRKVGDGPATFFLPIASRPMSLIGAKTA